MFPYNIGIVLFYFEEVLFVFSLCWSGLLRNQMYKCGGCFLVSRNTFSLPFKLVSPPLGFWFTEVQGNQTGLVEPGQEDFFWLPKSVKNGIEVVFYRKWYEQNDQIAEHPPDSIFFNVHELMGLFLTRLQGNYLSQTNHLLLLFWHQI